MPAWAIDIIKSNYNAFFATPLLFIFSLGVGAFVGHLFSKLIHKGKIDALEERVKLKTEQIEVKDNTIQSMSADRAKLEHAAMSPAPAQAPSERPRGNPRFTAVNDQITKNTEDKLRELLLNGTFNFVFNPATGGSKALTFLSNGEIGAGRNKNENRWRIVDGRLEILSGDGGVYTLDSFLTMDRELKAKIIEEANSLADKEGDIAAEDRRQIIFCPIHGLEEIISCSTEDSFLATLKVAREEKYIGWELREINREEAAGKEKLEPKKFPFDLEELLPWWRRSNEFKEAKEAEASTT